MIDCSAVFVAFPPRTLPHFLLLSPKDPDFFATLLEPVLKCSLPPRWLFFLSLCTQSRKVVRLGNLFFHLSFENGRRMNKDSILFFFLFDDDRIPSQPRSSQRLASNLSESVIGMSSRRLPFKFRWRPGDPFFHLSVANGRRRIRAFFLSFEEIEIEEIEIEFRPRGRILASNLLFHLSESRD